MSARRENEKLGGGRELRNDSILSVFAFLAFVTNNKPYDTYHWMYVASRVDIPFVALC